MKTKFLSTLLIFGIIIIAGCSEESMLTDLESDAPAFRTTTSNQTSSTYSPSELIAFAKKGGKSKVDVCHTTGKGFQIISVSSQAVDAHVAHGDGIPGMGYTNDCRSDLDSDGVADEDDAFPNDPSESSDADGDGVGDNADAFPSDPNETGDADGDGVGDNSDAFPNDATESVDTDGDGIGDNSDPFPEDPNNGVGSCSFTANDIPTQINQTVIWDLQGNLTPYTSQYQSPEGVKYIYVTRQNFAVPGYFYLRANVYSRQGTGWTAYNQDITAFGPGNTSTQILEDFASRVCDLFDSSYVQYQDATVEEEGEFDEEEGEA